MEEVKLCKDCKWLKGYGECSAPRNYDIVNYVSGSSKRDFIYADNVRRIDSRCGHEAKWFEAREEVVEEQGRGHDSLVLKVALVLCGIVVLCWYLITL